METLAYNIFLKYNKIEDEKEVNIMKKKLFALGLSLLAMVGTTLTISENVETAAAQETNVSSVESDVTNLYTGDDGKWTDMNAIVDGDNTTGIWFAQSLEVGNYIQITYTSPKEMNYLKYVFDTGDHAGDYFVFKVQYLSDSNWIDATSEIDYGGEGVASFNEAVTTTAIRITVTNGRDCWAKIHEIETMYTAKVINNGFTLVNTLGNMVDNDIDTYTFFDWHYTSDNNVVLDYGKNITVKNIMLLTGHYGHPDNELGTAVLSYSLDGTTYTDIGTYEGINIYADLSATPVEARYIKMTPVVTGQAANGLQIREFGANLSKFTPNYTFSGDTLFEYDGKAHSPVVTVSYGVPYVVTYNSDDLGVFGQTEAIKPAFWAMVINVEENNIYENFAGSHWKVFQISGKLTPTITISLNGVTQEQKTGGQEFTTDALPEFTFEVSDGATATYYYQNNDTEENLGTTAPTTPGTYSYNVKVETSDKFNATFNYYWYKIKAATTKVDPAVTVDGDTVFSYDGNPHMPKLVVPEGVTYTYHFEQNDKIFNEAPTAIGTYSLVYVTSETDEYNSYSHWVVFTIKYTKESFMYEWAKLRADGGENGICGYLNDANSALAKVLDNYNTLTAEEKEWVKTQIDDGDVTIGETLKYIASARSWINEKLDVTNEVNNVVVTLEKDNYSVAGIALIAVLGIASLVGYFVLNKKRAINK